MRKNLDGTGHEGTADAPASLDHVLREEAALAVVLAAVRSDAAHSFGLGVHHGVQDLIGEPAQQFLHVDGAVFEPGHGEHVRHQVW